ncbi:MULTISPECIES: phage holin, lambda family [Rodentibacter]|uniref:Phage holin, lambda family n=1 Tax=Rodentibacter genomosp. 2 TaxID=1908266 RepID=A0A1V3JH64_9PAST|nr:MULTISPECIES: phage holin, lambda family [Rodentibacter]MCQ9124345.1 phage holin, lambda family [Rodentibacter heylii]OOF55779.1 phage holin, lambda family [Rodentibacter genomosp. 2]
MPNNNYDIWAMIWNWLMINIGPQAIQSAAAAVIMSFLRAAFMRKKRAFRYTLIDAAICASIAGSVVPLLSHAFGHAEFSGFAGTMIGFIGTEKLREYLFKFINRRTESIGDE